MAAFLGKAWVDQQIKRELTRFEGLQDEKLRKLGASLDVFHNRAVNLHTQEFQVLPELWDRLSMAVSEGLRVSSVGQQYPSIWRMGDGELADYLALSPLREWQIGEIRMVPAEERDERLHEMLKWHRLHHAEKLHAEFHNYLISKGIFVDPDLREGIRHLSNMNYDALSERRLFYEIGSRGEESFVKSGRLAAEGVQQMQAIGESVRNRLWNSDRV